MVPHGKAFKFDVHTLVHFSFHLDTTKESQNNPNYFFPFPDYNSQSFEETGGQALIYKCLVSEWLVTVQEEGAPSSDGKNYFFWLQQKIIDGELHLFPLHMPLPVVHFSWTICFSSYLMAKDNLKISSIVDIPEVSTT